MKWLVHLYPKKWRNRYGEEFLDILENRELSIKEVLDVMVNAIDARFLNLVEELMGVDKKFRNIMLQSVLKRFLILGTVILLGLFGGYWLANAAPSVLELPASAILLIGAALGLFSGYVIGLARGITRVVKTTQKEDVYLPTGKLKFDKT
ncbi:hypothetical protein [Planococcus salinus]|uniref:Uncharacterized protein n=1 Tax=Planococcus salinus TaxID=1848460 RepID=A0A3M8P7M3_9BACL|nr:hypothetical protein [Planococcus salinus]RNF39194.1 hypothetical protein EEX84_10870 [Planococcus salinus]